MCRFVHRAARAARRRRGGRARGTPPRSTPVTSTSSPPIMKSMWMTLSFTRERSSSLDDRRVAVAERDVADGVLVEQRLEERRAQPADTALTVDERYLTEPRRAVVEGGTAAHDLFALVGGDLDGRPCSKRTTSPLTIGPSNSASGRVEATTPSVRAGSGVVNTSSLGRFAMCTMPSTVSPRAVCHSRRERGPRRGRCPAPRSGARRARPRPAAAR